MISAESVQVRGYSVEVRPGTSTESVVISNGSLEVVNKFCYLGDMISAGDGVQKSAVARIRWGVEIIYGTFACTNFQGVFTTHKR